MEKYLTVEVGMALSPNEGLKLTKMLRRGVMPGYVGMALSPNEGLKRFGLL